MQFTQRLFDYFIDKAQQVDVQFLSIGLGYTVVTTSNGGMGLSYTYFRNRECCAVLKKDIDYEGQSAAILLGKITSEDPIERSMALALINALNYEFCAALPEDKTNRKLIEHLRIGPDTHVGMVGHIEPLEQKLLDIGAQVEIIDHFKSMGSWPDFSEKIKEWAEVLLITSTTILNDSIENIIDTASENVRIAVLGPGTPLVSGIFKPLNVKMLAGIHPVNQDEIIKLIRHGKGTRFIHRYSRKVYLGNHG